MQGKLKLWMALRLIGTDGRGRTGLASIPAIIASYRTAYQMSQQQNEIISFFLYQGLAASKGKQPPLCRGQPHKKVKTKNPFTLTFTPHSRSDTPWYSRRGATRQVSAVNSITIFIGPGHTRDPRQDSAASSEVPSEVPDPPSYRVESVALLTLYQSYYPISHTPPCIPI